MASARIALKPINFAANQPFELCALDSPEDKVEPTAPAVDMRPPKLRASLHALGRYATGMIFSKRPEAFIPDCREWPADFLSPRSSADRVAARAANVARPAGPR